MFPPGPCPPPANSEPDCSSPLDRSERLLAYPVPVRGEGARCRQPEPVFARRTPVLTALLPSIAEVGGATRMSDCSAEHRFLCGIRGTQSFSPSPAIPCTTRDPYSWRLSLRIACCNGALHSTVSSRSTRSPLLMRYGGTAHRCPSTGNASIHLRVPNSPVYGYCQGNLWCSGWSHFQQVGKVDSAESTFWKTERSLITPPFLGSASSGSAFLACCAVLVESRRTFPQGDVRLLSKMFSEGAPPPRGFRFQI